MSIVSKKIMMGSGAVALPSDDEFNRVSFLSHFEGANNGVNNAFDDGSTSNHTITANGNATQGSFGPFARPDGEFAVHFDGEGFYHCAADADFAFGTGDFCMEAWVFVDADAYNYSRVFCFGPYYSNNDSHGLAVNGTDNNDKILYYDYRNSEFRLVSTTVTPIGEWFHIAVTKASNVMRLFYNGQIEATATNTGAPEASSTNTVAIGNAPDAGSGGEDFQGFISNARVVKGSAVYTSNFTPSTSKLTAITNTKLLTCQSNRFVDNSAEAHAITIGGAAGAIQVTAFGPFLTSAVYDAAVNGASSSPLNTANYLSIADGSWKTLGTGDFTWEFWFYGQAESTYMIGDSTSSQNASGTFTLGVSSKRMTLYYSDGTTAHLLQSPNSAPFYNLNEWHHVAYVRDGNVHKIYADGVLSASETRSITMHDSSGAQHIGNFGAGYSSGSNTIFSDVRLVKGTAVYSGSTYTVPTAPLTAISGTELLVNMADGQAIDSTAQNNLTLVGNTDTSTGQAKFGNTSLFYDGSGDGAYYANGAALGTGDWTIETFLWVNDFDAKLGVFQYGGATGALAAQVTTDQKLQVSSTSVAARLVTSGTINAQTWYHVAYVSYGGTLKVYINGTADSTTFDASSTTWTFTDTNIYVGARYYSNAVQRPFDGYLDEFRVSHFARYTSNFTAPSEPFADKGQ